jgi:hypothetical protein
MNDFWAFGAPCPKKEQKNVFAALLLELSFLNFGASRFFILELRFWGRWTL